MNGGSIFAAALIGASVIVASLVIALTHDDKTYSLSASSEGVYVLDRSTGRVRYCVSLIDRSGFVLSNKMHVEDQGANGDVSKLRAAGFSEQEIDEYIAGLEKKTTTDTKVGAKPAAARPMRKTSIRMLLASRILNPGPLRSTLGMCSMMRPTS